MSDTELVIGPHRFTSRLIVGTGKYADFETMRAAHEASGAQMVTVAVRRVDLNDRSSKSLLGWMESLKALESEDCIWRKILPL